MTDILDIKEVDNMLEIQGSTEYRVENTGQMNVQKTE